VKKIVSVFWFLVRRAGGGSFRSHPLSPKPGRRVFALQDGVAQFRVALVRDAQLGAQLGDDELAGLSMESGENGENGENER
jgi:hypothetical protein